VRIRRSRRFEGGGSLYFRGLALVSGPAVLEQAGAFGHGSGLDPANDAELPQDIPPLR
jgi:hypothetical protein